MRILVTGASGFVGGHVAARLDAQGHEIIATGRNPAKLNRLPLVRGRRQCADLSRDVLAGILEGCEAVIHCAALAAPWGAREDFLRHNVEATGRLLEASLRTGSVKRFVHISSPSIYFQPRDQLNLTEEFSPPARWPTHYGESKWLSECKVRQPQYRKMGPIILRPRAVYGPGDNAIAPRLLAVARRGTFPLVSGGASLVDVSYIDNVVDAVVLALQAPAALEGRAFNITNGEPIPVSQLVRGLFASLKLDVKYRSLPRALAMTLAGIAESIARIRPGQPEPRLTRYGLGLLSYSQTLSIDAARRDLAYAPKVSTHSGLERYAAWYAHHA